MRLIVVDTNVIVSAGIRVGTPPAELLMDWILEGRLQIVTSPKVVAEYREVMQRPKFQRYGFPPMWLDFLIDESLHLPDTDREPVACPGPDDTKFLSLARSSGGWLITGNLKHFPEDIRGDVRLHSPAEYLEILSRT